MSAEELSVTPHPAAPRPPRPAGRFLTLAGVTPDGRRLRLVDVAGTEFTLEIDVRLRAALGASPAPETPPAPSPAKVETQMDSMLRPRDIQARIRAGETPESVAAAAQTTVEKVMPYAAPVLAEREHIAARAQRSSIRRPAGETQGASRALGEAITGHLHSRNVDPEVVTWDAWRREDGRWALAGRFSIQGRDGLAELTFDGPGNFVVLDNDDARWLVGDLQDPVAEPEADAAPVRRLSSVPHDEAQLSLGDDVLGLVPEADQPLEAFLDDAPGLDESALAEEAADAAALDDEPSADRAPDRSDEPPSRRPVKKTRGRASVPSWDEIMFGGPTE